MATVDKLATDNWKVNQPIYDAGEVRKAWNELTARQQSYALTFDSANSNYVQTNFRFSTTIGCIVFWFKYFSSSNARLFNLESYDDPIRIDGNAIKYKFTTLFSGLSTDTWYHFVFNFNNGELTTAYLNGEETTHSEKFLQNQNVFLGNPTRFLYGNYFNGALDEVICKSNTIITEAQAISLASGTSILEIINPDLYLRNISGNGGLYDFVGNNIATLNNFGTNPWIAPNNK